MTDEVIEQTQGTEQAPPNGSETEVVKAQVQEGVPDTTEKEAETDDQKNERVQREAVAKQEKKARGVQQRMNELTREKHEERRRADEYAAQNARLLEAVLAGKGNGTAAASTEGEPESESFTDYNDYVRALARYEAKQVSKAEVAETTKVTTEANQRQMAEQAIAREQSAYADRARQAAKTLPDYAEVMEDASTVDIPPNVLSLIRKMPDGPVIAYHMVKNPQLAEQFFNTDDPQMHGVLLGQISATIKGTAKVSNAPPPGKGVQSKPGTGTAAPSDPDQYMIWRAKNLR